MFDEKQIGRAEVVDSFNSYTIQIPAQRSWFTILFLCFWLCGWLLGELFAIYTIFNDSGDGFTNGFLIFWLLGWTFGGIAACLSVLFQLVGKYRFVLSREQLILTRTIFGIGPKRKYQTGLIKAIQYHEPPSFSGILKRITQNDPRVHQGFIQFNYDGRTVHWGKGLSASAAKELYDDIKSTAYFDREQFIRF